METKEEKRVNKNYSIVYKKKDFKNSPTGINIYTKGLSERYNHPDIQIVLNFKKEIIENVLYKCIEKINSGEKFFTDIIYDDILPKEHKVIFKEKKIKNKKVYRLIFPDHNNNINKDDIDYDFLKQFK